MEIDYTYAMKVIDSGKEFIVRDLIDYKNFFYPAYAQSLVYTLLKDNYIEQVGEQMGSIRKRTKGLFKVYRKKV